MILTKDLIEKGKSVNNGWSTAQMKALGVTVFKKGWFKNLIGSNISQSAYDEFIALKDKHISEKSKRKKEQKNDFIPVVSNLSWKEQYLHPNWQKMRLIILNRDGFKCVNCSAKDKTLHVHHLKYLMGKFIWEVPKWYLVTLCEDCHSVEHNRDLTIKKFS